LELYGEWPTASSGRFTPGKEPKFPLNGGWVAARAVLDDLDKTDICCLCLDYWVPCSRTALSTHNTCCHNTANLITLYFYWLSLQKCNFSQAQCKLPEDGPSGPKHVGVNVRYFDVNFNILYV